VLGSGLVLHGPGRASSSITSRMGWYSCASVIPGIPRSLCLSVCIPRCLWMLYRDAVQFPNTDLPVRGMPFQLAQSPFPHPLKQWMQNQTLQSHIRGIPSRAAFFSSGTSPADICYGPLTVVWHSFRRVVVDGAT
jgi:hypothetical protein